MLPKTILHSIRQRLTHGASSRQLVPIAKPQAEPMLSGRVSMSLLTDSSPSLDRYIEPVRAAYQQCLQQVSGDPWLRERADVSVYCLGDNTPAAPLARWVAASRLEIPPLPRCSHTPLCGAVAQVLDTAVQRGESLSREHHCDQSLNLVVVMSDFMPTDGLDAQPQMDAALRCAAEAGVQLVLLTVGEADRSMAASMAQPGRPPVQLADVDDFTVFFSLLGRSIRQCSIAPGNPSLQLDFKGQSLRFDS